MSKRKICVVIGSRANYGRIKSVLEAITEHSELELRLIAEASALLYRFGKVIDVIKGDGYRIDATVYSIVEGENPTTMAKSTGLAIMELATIFEKLQPDVVLTVADRFETIGTAIAASYMNIPVAHTQGGELTGSIDENVRHAVTKLSHIHFPATQQAGKILEQMGEEPFRIHVTGCPAIDVARRACEEQSDNLFGKYGGTGPELDWRKPFLVVLQHPVTTEYGQGFAQINQTAEAVKRLGLQTVWFWPNVDAGSDDVSKGLRVFRNANADLPTHFYRSFTPGDFARLIKRCTCLVGNSSSGIREGSFLGVPVVNIGTRQRGRERCDNVIDTDYDADQIVDAVKRQLDNGRYPSSQLYGDGRAGGRIAGKLAEADLDLLKRFHVC